MKFTHVYDIKREVRFNNISQIRETKVSEDGVYFYTVPYAANVRALDTPMLELYVSSPMPDIIRVEACHFAGGAANIPKFAINDRRCPLKITDTEEHITIASGDTRLEIDKRPATFTFYYKNRKLTAIGNTSDGAAMGTAQNADGFYLRAQLELDVGEKIYGLGEHFSPFVRNGQSVDIWNEDAGTCTYIAYKNIPFYITNRGYGVLVNDSGPVSFEVASEYVTRVQFSVPGEKLDFMVIGGGDMKGVLRAYTGLIGRPALPPAWSFGLWLTSSFLTDYDEKTVMSFVDGMAERKIPLHVFHFDCYWMRENEWCGFEWDERQFPDIEGILSRMKAKGLKICVWINPYIGQKSKTFYEAKEKGYLLKRPNGDVWQWDWWQSGMGIVDFTNPEACKWYQGKLKKLLDQGVDCFKTDFGERIPTDCVYYDGSDPLRMHNYYTYLYNQCVFELLEKERGIGEATVFARSATVGTQKFPVHWGGDCTATYVSMAESLRGGLSLCLSGFGFWSHDISGFNGTARADVYKRWAAFGLLSTHSRLHGCKSYRVPWLFSKEGEQNGEESVAVVKYFTEWKCRLMPYIYSAAVCAHEEGIPAMRAMPLEFPGDLACEDLDRQYMLGGDLLVAPVFTESGDVDYYLPRGRWTHLFSDEVREGGQWFRENYDFFSLPLFVRENTVLPVGANDQVPDYDFGEGLTLHVYALREKAHRDIADNRGGHLVSVDAERKDGRITVTLDRALPGLKIRLHHCGSEADGREIAVPEGETVIVI